MVGIGGIGMSGIAELLQGAGYEVSGSDLAVSPVTARLRSAGIQVAEGHAASHVGSPDVVVVSSAVPRDNPELAEAERRGIPIVGRGQMLAALAERRRTVAVAGSHGKTTTTSMVALVLEAAGLDPTAVIGGVVDFLGGNARRGSGPFMVVEADESDRSFLYLTPEIAVVTNVDDEHLEAYDGLGGLVRAVGEFAAGVPEDGCVVACADDPRVARIAARCGRPVVTYGIDEESAAVRADRVEFGRSGSRARVRLETRGRRSDPDLDLQLGVPGRHNLLNALAALGVASWLGIDPRAAADALGGFRGVERRYSCRRVAGDIDIVDDYAHHPTEIEAVLQTARLGRPARLIAVFQPHRYSRTARLLDRFGQVLARADALVVTGVYAASESPVEGIDAAAVARAVRRHAAVPVEVADGLEDAASRVVELARAGDTIVVLGAGSIGRLAPHIAELLERRGS
jgi:UDP-N-acetylmuramate--alanine ligase